MTRLRLSISNPWGLTLHCHRERSDGSIQVFHDPVVTSIKPDDMEIVGQEWKPLLVIDHRDTGLQDLMDSMWQLGIRPRDIGTTGHLAATQAHLNDFRAIVSKQLNIKLP